MPESDEAARIFSDERRLLTGVAYRVLGRVSDAEDVVQDAWMRWSGVPHGDVADPRSYLVRIVTRLAIDRLRSAQSRREEYVGGWLPEPWLTVEDDTEVVEQAEAVSLAMLLLMERLSPVERAVFVLREAFGFAYAEIAEVVERSEPAVRQVATRARSRVREDRPRFDTDPATRRRLTERFLEAGQGGDLDAFMQLLAPDVQLLSDGGGKAKAPLRTIVGVDKVARFLAAIASDPPYPDMDLQIREVNGAPAIVATTAAGVPVVLFGVEVVGGLVVRVYLLANPEKMTGLRL